MNSYFFKFLYWMADFDMSKFSLFPYPLVYLINPIGTSRPVELGPWQKGGNFFQMVFFLRVEKKTTLNDVIISKIVASIRCWSSLILSIRRRCTSTQTSIIMPSLGTRLLRRPNVFMLRALRSWRCLPWWTRSVQRSFSRTTRGAMATPWSRFLAAICSHHMSLPFSV